MLLFSSCCLWCAVRPEGPRKCPWGAAGIWKSQPLDHRSRRGIRGETAWMPARAGPSEAEGPEGGERRGKAISTRRKEKRALHCTSMGSLGAAAPKWRFAHFFAMEKVGRAGARNTPPPEGRHPPPPAGWRKTGYFCPVGNLLLCSDAPSPRKNSTPIEICLRYLLQSFLYQNTSQNCDILCMLIDVV